MVSAPVANKYGKDQPAPMKTDPPEIWPYFVFDFPLSEAAWRRFDVGDVLSGNLDEVLGNTAPAPGVRGRVKLSPEAASLARPDDVVFVFARQESDDRMPIAALSRRAGELPFEFELTDRNAMVKDRLLSDRDEVIVTARVSRSGKAGDNSLHLGATSKPVSTDGSARVELTISSGMQAQEVGNE